MSAGPGQQFEDQFRASIPAGCYVRRLRTPTAMGSVVPRLVALIESLSTALHSPVPGWVAQAARFRFTPKAGFDLLVTAPAATGCLTVSGHGWTLALRPSLLFALELKSVEGISVPFANVDPGQEKALTEAADAGHAAFLVIEFRKVGEVWAIPIQSWRDIRLVALRASLPVADARRVGLQILPDPGRGKSKAYWALDEFLADCGALIPEAAPKAKKAAPAAPPMPFPNDSPRLFD